ncbi:Transcription factor [Vigna angularis]|uniref:Transcription factor n=1 Tax=Phaseolus angularis TaxID=3914 RepID=A0A8T0JHD9_PHAAN|nr:Transcription factor [Vigna angularis]
MVALVCLGKWFDMANDFRLRFAKEIRGERLVVLDEHNKRDILIPGTGGVTIKAVSELQMSELLNQKLTVKGKVPDITEMRTPSWDNRGLKKGTWTPEEDRKLVAYVTRYGSWNWRQLPRFADNEIKNHWHTTLKKRFGKKAVYTETNVKASKSNSFGSNPDKDCIENNGFFLEASHSPTVSKASDPDPLSPELSSSEFSSSDYTTHQNLFLEDGFDFLDAYLADMNQNISTESFHISQVTSQANGIDNFHGSDAPKTMECVRPESPLSYYNENSLVENDDFGFLEEIEPITEHSWTEAFVADMSLIPNELLVPLVNESESYFSSAYDVDDIWCLKNNSHMI